MKTTIMEEFAKTADRFGDKPAIKAKANSQWKETTWVSIQIISSAFVKIQSVHVHENVYVYVHEKPRQDRN